MNDIKAVFRRLEGPTYDARELESAMVALRASSPVPLSPDYTIDGLIRFADRQGWIRRIEGDPHRVEVKVT